MWNRIFWWLDCELIGTQQKLYCKMETLSPPSQFHFHHQIPSKVVLFILFLNGGS